MVNIFSPGNSSLDLLIQTILQIESRPRFAMEDKKASFQVRNQVLSDLDSKLSALNTIAKRLTDPITDYFAAKTASTSNKDLFTVSAGSKAVLGSHDITIARLASSDTRVSKQYTSTGTGLKSFFDSNGSQTFQIQVAHPTATDKNNRVSISVTINSSGATDDDVLDDIALAINDAMSSAVTAKTIDADEKLSASVVHEEDGTSRLIFKSNQSGFTNRMVMTDSANSLLSTLEIINNVASSGTAGGYITSVGTSASDSLLNAKMLIDGLTFYRDSNSISDVIDGVTLTLKSTTTATENFKVSEDSEAVKTEIEDFVNAYNDVLQFLRDNAHVDGKLGVRGPLAGDTTYTFLRTNLRSLFTSTISSVASGNPQNLFEIGIESSQDGTLTLSDTAEFEEILSAGSIKVSDLFNSANGVASQIKTFLNDFIKVGGILDDSQKSITERINNLDNRMDRFDVRLARREVQLRQQFAKMQQASVLIASQSSAFGSIAGLGF